MKVLVTGAAGFIGSHLLPELAGAGWESVAFDKSGGGSAVVGARFFRGDVVTGQGLDDAASGVDAVVHLAARNHVLHETAKDPLAEYRRVNVIGTENVFRAASRAGIRTFVHMSSVKAMGEGSFGILNEKSPCTPTTAYGISKLESEEILERSAQRSSMRVVVLRLPMVYGPGNVGNFPRLIRWADRGLPFPLFRPDHFRSVVYVGNVVAAVIAVLRGTPRAFSTYIVKDSEDCSSRMLYSAVCRELGKPARLLPVPGWMARIAAWLSDDFRKIAEPFRVNSAMIEQEIGFLPPVPLGEGIARTVKWHRRWGQ